MRSYNKENQQLVYESHQLLRLYGIVCIKMNLFAQARYAFRAIHNIESKFMIAVGEGMTKLRSFRSGIMRKIVSMEQP